MRKTSLKPIILSALLATTFAATTVGTTFALFTDRADTTITVTAGKVDLDVSYSTVTAYSLDETDNTKYVNVTESGKFATNGTWSLEDGVLTLTNMVPGDKVELSATLINKSNVKTKFRFNPTGTGELAPWLTVTYSGGAYKTGWTDLNPAESEQGDTVGAVSIVVELKNDQTEILPREQGADNIYQGKKASYNLAFEMVQGNANVQ